MLFKLLVCLSQTRICTSNTPQARVSALVALMTELARLKEEAASQAREGRAKPGHTHIQDRRLTDNCLFAI